MEAHQRRLVDISEACQLTVARVSMVLLYVHNSSTTWARALADLKKDLDCQVKGHHGSVVASEGVTFVLEGAAFVDNLLEATSNC